jgi:hypothetical protein
MVLQAKKVCSRGHMFLKSKDIPTCPVCWPGRYKPGIKQKSAAGLGSAKVVGNTSMKTTPEHDAKFARMTFASVYPQYIKKVERKGRTKAELDTVITWLTGFSEKKLHELIVKKVTLEAFFKDATLHPNAHLITGTICGYRIEDIENPLTRNVRYLDKLVDELAKGRVLEKILRK